MGDVALPHQGPGIVIYDSYGVEIRPNVAGFIEIGLPWSLFNYSSGHKKGRTNIHP